MKKLKFILIILLFVRTVIAQDQDISQPKELNIAQIEHKAKADAKADFWQYNRPLIWFCGPTLSGCVGWFGYEFLIYQPEHSRVSNLALFAVGVFGPFAVSLKMPFNLPKEREQELLNKSSTYSYVYQTTYQKTFKKERFKHTLGGSATSAAIYLLITFLLGGLSE